MSGPAPRQPNQERLFQQILEERKRHIDEAARELLLAYAVVFHSHYGQMVLRDLRESYGGISFTPGYADVTAFKEGRRAVAEDIDQLLRRADELEVMPA